MDSTPAEGEPLAASAPCASGPTRERRRWLPLVFQIIVSLALLAWIFRDPAFRQSLGKVIVSANPWWLLAGFALAGAGNLIGAARWGLFLHALELKASARDVVRMSFVALFFNSFFVGAVGGDAVKVVWLAARGESKSSALVSVIVDRVSGIGALVLCSLAFMLARWDWLLRSPEVAALMRFVVIYLAAVVVLLGVSFAISLPGVVRRVPMWASMRRRVEEFTEAYTVFLRRPREALAASGLSLVMLVLYFLTFYCAARAYGVSVPVLDFMAFMPAVDIVAALPVSLGGFGVREQAFITLLGELCNVSADRAFSISLAGAMMSLGWGLVGLVFLPRGGVRGD